MKFLCCFFFFLLFSFEIFSAQDRTHYFFTGFDYSIGATIKNAGEIKNSMEYGLSFTYLNKNYPFEFILSHRRVGIATELAGLYIFDVFTGIGWDSSYYDLEHGLEGYKQGVYEWNLVCIGARYIFDHSRFYDDYKLVNGFQLPFYFFGGGLALGTATMRQFDFFLSDGFTLLSSLYSKSYQEETQTNLGYYLEAGYKIPFRLVLISLSLI